MMVVFTLVPVVVFTLVPAMLFRARLKRYRDAWTRRGTYTVRAAYRGTVVETVAPGRVPISVAVGSLVSLYVAVPVLAVAPLAVFAFADGNVGGALVGLVCSLLMVASAIVGCAILRPSREAATGALVVGGVLLLIALGAAFAEWTPLAFATAAHAGALLLAALANRRANVTRCV